MIPYAPRAAGVLRWIARILSVLSLGFVLLFLFGEGDFSQIGLITWYEWLLIVCFPVGLYTGMVLAWRWERQGSLISIAFLLLFYLLDGFEPIFFILTLPSFCFLAAHLLSPSPHADGLVG
jgi:hypothetical protein